MIYDIYPENVKKDLQDLLMFVSGGLNHFPQWAQKKLQEFKEEEIIAKASQMISDPSIPSGIKYNLIFFCIYNYGLGENAEKVKDLIYAAANFNWDNTLIPTNFKRHLKEEIIPTYIRYYEQKEQELLISKSKHIDYEI